MAFKHARAACVLALSLIALPAAAFERPPQLVDQTGRTFSLTSLRGTPLVVTFVSAHCTDACPLVNAQFSQAARRLAAEHRNVRLVTITLDPENDPPRMMRALAQTFQADPRVWIVAGGSVSEVHRVMREFGVMARRVAHDLLVDVLGKKTLVCQPKLLKPIQQCVQRRDPPVGEPNRRVRQLRLGGRLRHGANRRRVVGRLRR